MDQQNSATMQSLNTELQQQQQQRDEEEEEEEAISKSSKKGGLLTMPFIIGRNSTHIHT